MHRAKKARLEKKGWKVGTVQEFLGLSDEEAAYVEVRLRLATALRKRRQRAAPEPDGAWPVASVPVSRGSRRWRPADPSVSLDLLIRTLLALGASSRDLARAISHASLAEAS